MEKKFSPYSLNLERVDRELTHKEHNAIIEKQRNAFQKIVMPREALKNSKDSKNSSKSYETEDED